VQQGLLPSLAASYNGCQLMVFTGMLAAQIDARPGCNANSQRQSVQMNRAAAPPSGTDTDYYQELV